MVSSPGGARPEMAKNLRPWGPRPSLDQLSGLVRLALRIGIIDGAHVAETREMGPVPRFAPPVLAIVRAVLTVAALDGVVVGLWACLRPGDLFAWLQMPELPPEGPRDRLLLWAALGGINLVQAGFLAILVWRPGELGPLALAPLMGRLFGVGV